MEEQKLPMEDLREYGIFSKDDKLSSKLNQDDFQKFLKGYVIVVDNDKDRITFQLTNNNTKLKVEKFERDMSLDKLLKDVPEEIQYSKMTRINDNNKGKEQKYENYGMKVFIKEEQGVREYDLEKDLVKITKIVNERKNKVESDRYKLELLKMKGFLQDKIDKFPEIAKEITQNLNVVNNQINSVNSTTPELNKNSSKSSIDLDVNDNDQYQDANREREEKKFNKEEQEHEEEREEEEVKEQKRRSHRR